MKKSPPKNIEKYKSYHPLFGPPTTEGDIEGFYLIPYASDMLVVIVGCGDGWDHLSASLQHRTPTWQEMCWLKDLFFEPEETVIQIHPPKSRYVNFAEYALHMWRPWKQEIPLPPLEMV